MSFVHCLRKYYTRNFFCVQVHFSVSFMIFFVFFLPHCAIYVDSFQFLFFEAKNFMCPMYLAHVAVLISKVPLFINLFLCYNGIVVTVLQLSVGKISVDMYACSLIYALKICHFFVFILSTVE